MIVRTIYPVLMSEAVAETAEFYCSRFGFEKTFEADWYISLRHTEPPRHELAILACNHPSIPDGYRSPARGVLINIEVADATSAHEQLINIEKLPTLLPLRDEEWGQRHFITKDPSGNLIDVIENYSKSLLFVAVRVIFDQRHSKLPIGW